MLQKIKDKPLGRKQILFLVQFAMLLAIEAVFCFTPLGSLPIGPMVATFAMLPVIVAAILLGTGAGTLMGFFAGLFSFLVWTFMPPPTSAMFAFIYTPFYSLGEFQGNGWSLVVCFLPRILTGTFAGLTYSGLSKALVKLRARQHSRKMTGALAGIRAFFRNKAGLEFAVAGAVGSLTNTFLVLGGAYLFFGPEYAAAAGMGYELLLGALGLIILTNGIPEMIISILAAEGICRPLKKQLRHWSV